MEKVSAVKQPEWQIPFPELLDRMELSERKFRDFLRLPVIRHVQQVLPLKDVARVESVLHMSKSMLRMVLTKIKTQSQESPFLESRFRICKIDPQELRVGQKFVYRDNYTALLEELPGRFSEICMSAGMTELNAFVAIGKTVDETPCVAFYLPPIAERHEGLVVMDGMHRNFITKQAGTTITSIVADRVLIPFPCAPQDWSEVKVINLAEKPKDPNERYFRLRKELFRDLKYFGIDG